MQQVTLRTASALVITSLYCMGLTMTLEGCTADSAPLDTPAASAPAVMQPPPALDPPIQKPLTAGESDPDKMGWMQGSSPPPDRIIRFDLAGNMFPHTRCGYSHMCEFVSTCVMWRGDGSVSRLPRAERDVNGVLFTDPSGTHRTFAEALKLTYADSILIMHKGEVIYERYSGALDAHTQHIAMSIVKSFVDTLTATLVADGRLNPVTPVTQCVPELRDTAYGDATARQVTDMTVGMCYSENYAGPNADVWTYAHAGGMLPQSVDYKDPDNFYDYLATLRKEGKHDVGFAYKAVNIETLTWIVRRASNKSLATLLSERIWQPMGTQDDAYFPVDSISTEPGDGSPNTTLRDLTHFGEMARDDGRFSGKQILPKGVIDDIRHGSDPVKFAKAGYTTLSGYSYRNMWWTSSNNHHTFEACGIHGQRIYIDPVTQMTIMCYASYPIAANTVNDLVAHRAYAALAEYFI